MATIFLSHSSVDEPLVRQLEKWLLTSGFDDLFIDLTIRGGDKWPESLRNAKASCRVVLCLVTPNWLASPECEGEFSAAWYMGRRIIPLVALRGAQLDPVQERRRARVLGEDQGFDITPAMNPDGTLDLDSHPDIAEPLKAGLRAGGALAKVGLDPEAFEIDQGKRPAPFPGLESFGDDDADAAVFFGRSPEIAELLERLREMRASGELKPLVVLGASGSGKSSLVKAGVLPRLRRERSWLVLRSFRPGADPLYNFADAIARTFADYGVSRAAGPIRNTLRDAWRAAPRQGSKDRRPTFATDEGLAQINATLTPILNELRRLAGRPSATALISLDQGEEIARGESESADALCDVLRAALLPIAGQGEAPPAGCRLILSCRTDSFAELQSAPRFDGLECVSADIRAVPTYRYDDAVEGPAVRYGVQIEYSLVEALIEDSPGEDALPLLAFALERLWRQFAADRRIRKDDYDSLGKLDGLVEDAAERALRGIKPGDEAPVANLPADKDALGARTFVPALAQVSDRGSTIRRVASWTAFDAPARDMLELFASWRLVVKKGEEEPTVEVAHETIFRAWRRFMAWLEPEKARLEALRGAESAARTWDRGGRRGDDLTHRKRRLNEARSLERHPDFANLIEKSDAPMRDYLSACGRAEFQRGLLMGAGAAILVGAVFGGVVWSNEMRWRAQMEARASAVRPPTRTDAVALAIASSSPPGAMLSLFGPGDSRVMESLGLRLPGRDLGRISDGHLSGDGEWLFTRRYSTDGASQGRLWELREDSEPRELGVMSGDFAGYSDDGRWLLTRSYAQDGSYRGRLADLQGDSDPRDLGALDYWWFSPDGGWLVTNGYMRTGYESKLWDLRTAEEPADLGDIDTASVQFASDGAWVFYREYPSDGSDAIGRIRSLRKGGQNRDLGSVSSFQIAEDGSRLVTVGYDLSGYYVGKLWDLRAGGEPRDLGQIDPYAMTLSQNGDWLFAGRYAPSGAYEAVLYDLRGSAKPRILEGYYDDPTRVANLPQMSADGSWLVAQGSSAQTYSGELLNLRGGEDVALGDLDSYSSLFSADGDWLFTRVMAPDGVTQGRLWDLRDPDDPRAIDGIEFWLTSADGDWLLTSAYAADGSYRSQLRNLRTGGPPIELGEIDTYDAQFSADGATLLSTGYAPDGTYTVQVMDLRSGAGAWRDLGAAGSWQFSPSGAWLLTSGTAPDGTYQSSLWSMRRPDAQPIALGDIDTYAAQYSADDGRLFTRRYNIDGTSVGQVWDLSTGEALASVPLTENVYMSGDGHWLVTTGYTPEGYYSAELRNLDDGSAIPLGEVDAYSVAFSPDSNWLFTRGYDASGAYVGTLRDLTRGGEPRDVGDAQSWQFSPDGAWLSVSGYGLDGTYGARLFDMTSDGAEYSFADGWEGEILGFSGDGRWILTRGYGPDGSYVGQLWDFQRGDDPIDLGATDNWQFSADGAWIVVSGYQTDGSYQSTLYSLLDEREPLSLGDIDMYSPQFSADGAWLYAKEYLANGSARGLLWNLQEGGEARDLGGTETVQMSADGVWLFNLTASPITYWGELYNLQDGGEPRDLGSVAYTLLSPDGGWLLTNSGFDEEGLTQGRLLNLRDGGEALELGDLDTVYSQFSADGAWLFARTYQEDGSLRGRLWNLRDGGEPRELGAVESQAFSADGAWLFTREYADDGTYRGRLWDLRAAGEPRDLGAVESWVMSTNGAQFLTLSAPFGGNFDGRLWNLQAPVIEGEGADLRKGACEASKTLPFSRAARNEDRRLQGRPWHPCDWRGLLPSIEDGWEGARQWERMVRVRLGLADDYSCAEVGASGETNALRAQLCREAGETATAPQQELPDDPPPVSADNSVSDEARSGG